MLSTGLIPVFGDGSTCLICVLIVKHYVELLSEDQVLSEVLGVEVLDIEVLDIEVLGGCKVLG
jgi:hypothetical protein